MEDTVKPGELYSYHQNGIEEILSKRQLEDFFSQSGIEGVEFESWVKEQCQRGDLLAITPLEKPTKFGSLIAKRRDEMGISQEHLSQICLMSTEQLKWIEAGALQPDQNSLHWIANALGVQRSNLLNGEIKPKPDYQECLKNIAGMQEELLLAKEHLKYLNRFVEDHGLVTYQVQKHEDKFRITNKSGEELRLNGVVREWRDEKSAKQFADKLNQREPIKDEKKVLIHRYLVQEKEDELRSTKEIYVIIDRKTGEAVLDQNGSTLEFDNKETAQSYADRLNQKEMALESSGKEVAFKL